MKETPAHNAKMAKIVFATVYPWYVRKVVSKGRTEDELHQVISWLTGYTDKQLRQQIDKKVTLKEFFAGATLNPKAKLITGTICGYRVEEIKNPLTRKARYLDKIIDELAHGKPLEKICRS